jgi:hypothetical protein
LDKKIPDITSIISKPRGLKRKADAQLLPEEVSVANKENQPTNVEHGEIQNLSLHQQSRQVLGSLTPIDSPSFGLGKLNFQF